MCVCLTVSLFLYIKKKKNDLLPFFIYQSIKIKIKTNLLSRHIINTILSFSFSFKPNSNPNYVGFVKVLIEIDASN